ncbi:MAG: alkaline phosphatase family protein [Alphaproteobacteria bacterium]
MDAERITYSRVKKEWDVLAPGDRWTISFFPDHGPALAAAHSQRAPADVIIGTTNQPMDNARELLEQRLADSPLSEDERLALAEIGRPVPPSIDISEMLAEPVTAASISKDHDPNNIPPDPVPTIRMTLRRPRQNAPAIMDTLFTREVLAEAVSFAVANLPLVPEGFAPHPWELVLENISIHAQIIFGRVLYPDRESYRVTTIDHDLLEKLLRQTAQGLIESARLHGSTVVITFSSEAAAVIGRQHIFFDTGHAVFDDINFKGVSVALDEGLSSDGRGPFPRIGIQIEFEDQGIELRNLPIIGDVDLTGLRFRLRLTLAQSLPEFNPTTVAVEKWLYPYILADTDFEMDLDFDDTVAEAVDEVFKVRKNVTEGINDVLRGMRFSLSEYFQLGLNHIADRDRAFAGLRLKEGNWQVITGPDFTHEPLVPNIPEPGPMANPEPIDGPQPAEEMEALQRINHIVVLMMENRSYDHLLGYLTHPAHGGDPLYEGLSGDATNTIQGIGDAISTVMPHTHFFPSPPHDFDAVMAQIAEGQMTGFGQTFRDKLLHDGIPADARSIMAYHVAGQLPVYDFLVREFAVCTHWFAAHPGPTWPNRMCTLTGHTPFLRNTDLPREDIGYLDDKLLFDVLDEVDVNWRYYEHDVAFLRMFNRFRLDTGRVRPYANFAAEAAAGLPPVTFIDPNFVDIPSGEAANDDHPGGADMIAGQVLVADVINTLTQTPGWDNTMLIVTYDEHGGFYDHVPPPGSVESAGLGLGEVPKVHADGPHMLGVRTPTFIVSPRTERGAILNQIYDHTSIAKSILARFAPTHTHKLGRRVEIAAHVGGAVPLAMPRANIGSVPAVALSQFRADEGVEPNSFHEDMSTLGSPLHAPIEKLTSMRPVL